MWRSRYHSPHIVLNRLLIMVGPYGDGVTPASTHGALWQTSKP
jgi:hypothetical protein